MALHLPRIVVDLTGPSPRASASGAGPRVSAPRRSAPSAGGLRPGELNWLLGFDAPSSSLDAFAAPVERVLDLGGRRWAVGRRYRDHAVWRLVSEADLQALAHPAWLWTRDDWFRLNVPGERRLAAPEARPLRNVVHLASGVAGTRDGTVALLAATVAALRARPFDGPPIAVVADTAALAWASDDTGSAARWFVLALLGSLPPALREGLRIGVAEPNVGAPTEPSAGDRAGTTPDPDRFDLVITDRPPRGFTVIRAAAPPPSDEDLVAYYLRNRLLADDAEAVEAVAAAGGEGPDPWGAAVAELLQEGVPGVSAVDRALLGRDPEGAALALAARLRAGALLEDGLLHTLVEVTLRTGDPRPWAPLADRPAVERARAVQALLSRAADLRPGPALVRVLVALYPHGAALDPLLAALKRWIDGGSMEAVDALARTLHDWPGSLARAARARSWSEVVRALVRQGRHDDAMRAVVSPLSRVIVREGGARAVAGNWGAIPTEARSPELLGDLVALLAEAPDGGPAVSMLFRYVQEEPAEVAVLLRRWTELRGVGLEDDPLLEAIRRSDYVGDWLGAALDRGGIQEAAELAMRLARGPEDPLWIEVEAAHAARLDRPVDRLVAMLDLEPGQPALEPLARTLVGPALADARFPDADLAEVGRAFAAVDGSGIWPWLAITAAAPDRFDEGTIDATVVAFCAAPPAPELQEVALTCAGLLGTADRWDPLDHARWIVRLCLAPEDGTAFHLALATALVQGIARRADAVPRMADITDMLLELEPDHPALVRFVHLLLPNAWLGGVPRMYLQAVPAHRLPATLQAAWQGIVGT